MLACKHCSTPNSLDSTFCKKCGAAVPADQRREAVAQLDKLVDEGLAALNAGRTAEALAIADSAVATDPTHLGALHLKSAVHERRGEIAEALESAERVVELNPDSELDRIKRNGLRADLLNASTPVRPDRRVAFAAAAAAMVLVACAGILIARKPAEAPNSLVASTQPPTTGTVIEKPVQVQPPVSAPNPSVSSGSQTVPATVTTTTTTPTGSRTTTDVVLPPVDGAISQMPAAEGNGTTLQPVAPMQPTIKPPATNTVVKPQTPAQNDGDPMPKPMVPDESKDNGVYEISVSKGNVQRAGGSQTIPESRTNGSAAYAQVGTEKFQLGDYAGAAANLERAVSGGGNAISLNLMLAQAYGHLGRNSDAATAYERSRSAADAALASGKGNRERIQAQRDAAEAGLRTVRGG